MADYSLPDLPYDYGALEPYISGQIMELHHDKHHNTYVNGINTAVEQLAEARDQESFGSLRRDWCYPFVCSFRAGLYHAIQAQDPTYACMHDQAAEWLDSAWDAALVFAIFEVAGFAHVCCNDALLYVYNLDSPLKAGKEEAIRCYLQANQPSRLSTVSRYD